MGQVISQDNLILQRQIWKGNGQSVVFVSGCFDLLHPGHIRLLEQARSYGDVLVVGVKSDAAVHAAKARSTSNGSAKPGVGQPITTGSERAEILAALAAIDFVVQFDENSPEDLIARLSPEFVVQGAAPASAAESGSHEGRAANGTGVKRVKVLLEPGYSTRHLLERITQHSA